MQKKPILPPTFFWMATIVSLLLHLFLPILIFIRYPWTLLGFVLIIFGAVLNIWADQIFKRRKTTVKPFEQPAVLVTDGPFAWSRHPMYLGMVAIVFGISIICGSLSSFIGPILFWVIVRIRFIPAEEKSLAEVFGEEYDAYKKKIRSWM
jgi:protein-S-isoprenylcysteine O-methyltransferase Ste14